MVVFVKSAHTNVGHIRLGMGGFATNTYTAYNILKEIDIIVCLIFVTNRLFLYISAVSHLVNECPVCALKALLENEMVIGSGPSATEAAPVFLLVMY